MANITSPRKIPIKTHTPEVKIGDNNVIDIISKSIKPIVNINEW